MAWYKHQLRTPTHLRFVDDKEILAESLEELNTMLGNIHIASQRLGLKMDMDKAKIN